MICAFTATGYGEAKGSGNNSNADWWRDAKFGLFIHWGVYSVPAGVWKGTHTPGNGEWIMYRLQIPVAEYKAFAQGFTAAKYDPAAWARLAREAGARYVVITSKHHDGFALFDTKVSDWNAKNSPAGRDLIAPLENAVRQEGLKFGLYYSQSQDWVNRGGAKRNPNFANDGIKNLLDGQGWDELQKGVYDEYLKTVALPQVREIFDKYNPDIIWWDTPVEMTSARMKPFLDEISRHPNTLTNNRLAENFQGDFSTPEQTIPARGDGRAFEVCMTMNKTWGYRTDDANWKSVDVLLRNLSDIVSKGGNFLLNVGPTPEGEIPAPSVERLHAMGDWMRVNGEAIYGTNASPFPRRLPWGRVTRKPTSDGGEILYLHVWEWPTDGKILLPGLDRLPTGGRLLANDEAVTATHSADGVVINLPGTAPDASISVVRLAFAQPVSVKATAGVPPGADGVITLDPTHADCQGSIAGNIEVRGTGADAFLTNWTGPRFHVEYIVQTPKAGKWLVRAEVAAEKNAKLAVGLREAPVASEIIATGGMDKWQTVDLGTIELPAGENLIDLRPDKASWNPVNLRRVTLSPAP